MSGSEDPFGGDEGTTAEVHAVDEQGHLMGPGVGHSLSATHDARALGRALGIHQGLWRLPVPGLTHGRVATLKTIVVKIYLKF